MRTVVFGGSGLIGRRLIEILQANGHEAVSASPSQGVDAVSGQGLQQALQGADIVIDVMNSPSFEDNAVLAFFQSSTRNVIAAAKQAGIKHYVALSVVGTERLQASGYFRAKLVQEQLIEASGLPYTIVRATQFYEFMMFVAQVSTEAGTVRVPSAKLQPIAAADVSQAMADVALASPLNATVEIAGPDQFGLDDLVRKVLVAHADQRPVVTDDAALYVGMLPIDDRSLTPGANPRLGPTRYEAWLQANAA